MRAGIDHALEVFPWHEEVTDLHIRKHGGWYALAVFDGCPRYLRA